MTIRRPLQVGLGLFIALLHIPLSTHAAVQTYGKILQPEEQEEQKNVRVLPFFAPTYSPEMRVVFNTGVLLSFKTDPDDPDLQRSSIPFAIGVGTTGSARSSSLLTTFWLSDMIRFNANLWLKIMPDNYYGGAGPILMYDSRDMTVNAYSGICLYGGATFYGGYLGSDNIYQIFDVDYRQYRTIGRPGQRIAWQLRSRIGVGNVPWAEMSQPGIPWDLRGYHWGQYRHNTMFLALSSTVTNSCAARTLPTHSASMRAGTAQQPGLA